MQTERLLTLALIAGAAYLVYLELAGRGAFESLGGLRLFPDETPRVNTPAIGEIRNQLRDQAGGFI